MRERGRKGEEGGGRVREGGREIKCCENRFEGVWREYVKGSLESVSEVGGVQCG